MAAAAIGNRTGSPRPYIIVTNVMLRIEEYFVMDEESWATVYFNVLLDGCLCGGVFVAGEFSVRESETRYLIPQLMKKSTTNWPGRR